MAAIHSSLVWRLPPPGKPNPKEERPPLHREDLRSRVTQQAQKGESVCWLYAMNLFRYRFNAPNTHHLPERLAERAVSCLRKTTKTAHEFLVLLSDLDVAAEFQQVSQETLKTKDAGLRDATLSNQRCSLLLGDLVDSYMKSNTSENFHEYLTGIYTSQLISAYREAVKSMDQSSLCDPLKWLHQLPPIEELHYLQRIIIQQFTKTVHLRHSDWTPRDPFATLIRELEQYGPLCVEGFLGKPYYHQAATVRDVVQNHQIFGWNPEHRKKPEEILPITHTIVLIGAQKKGAQELVYFIDPLDKSSPKKNRIIYVMSYKRLTDPDSIVGISHLAGQQSAPPFFGYRNATLAELETASSVPETDSKDDS